MGFKGWLAENETKDFNYFKDMVLGKLGLDHHNGLSQPLDSWQPENLIRMLSGLGEYMNLPSAARNQVEGHIRTGTGTVGDLIRLMASGGTA